MTWPFVQDGIPILYYGKIFAHSSIRQSHLRSGQEQGYTGGATPENREAYVLLVLSKYDSLMFYEGFGSPHTTPTNRF
jgi:hypothetical protein